VKTHQNQIDQRPFRSKAEQEREVALHTQYQRLALPAVVAAVQPAADSTKKDTSQEQMG
jgi:hypothetical protein